MSQPISKAYAVIVAGGSGTRMQSALPKQFIPLHGRPIMMYTIEAFVASGYSPEIILVLHADYHGLWTELCNVHNFAVKHTLIAGGETRFHSVKNAIDQITDKNVLIAVHDAVRPLVSKTAIDKAYLCAETYGTAVVAVKSRDSVRHASGTTSASIDRESIYLVQTPQTFKSDLLRAAYTQPYNTRFTDDASVVECSGAEIKLVAGSYTNFKITFPEDITIAEALINKKPPA
ncbi:2-C-methyl-D-erythritol 4-phosphate cytidylyltransferase [Mucilaginibacter terrenus]|uniref:2-C-methyl-D-erythritol 4-phosphate cytidylyltransferase n=1 Tax=Mucilaginibacter terrenus TaxID=2482727 RepID=A0A3E2NYL3_9SPHI|nr:2-C-methyl-D-erythritol 4-phosphate cytidylyltransferase [Mucilaginibacter terrenus]RFZ86093.1 2-C-methyl-D-erythritol 4-phosphate cytidylyltransferase [Mucilaginibacter terrenus]